MITIQNDRLSFPRPPPPDFFVSYSNFIQLILTQKQCYYVSLSKSFVPLQHDSLRKSRFNKEKLHLRTALHRSAWFLMQLIQNELFSKAPDMYRKNRRTTRPNRELLLSIKLPEAGIPKHRVCIRVNFEFELNVRRVDVFYISCVIFMSVAGHILKMTR